MVILQLTRTCFAKIQCFSFTHLKPSNYFSFSAGLPCYICCILTFNRGRNSLYSPKTIFKKIVKKKKKKIKVIKLFKLNLLHLSFQKVLFKSVLLSIISCRYLSLTYQNTKVLYKNVLLSSKNVDLRNLTSLIIPKRNSFKWRVTVSGELMFLESYGTVTSQIQLLSFYDVTKQFLITISDKHRNCPAVNIQESQPLTVTVRR